MKDKHKLSSLERVRKAMQLQKPDVIPVGTFMGNHAAKIAGVPLIQYYNDSKKMLEAQIFALDKYNQDIVIMQSDNYYIAEGFGTKTTHYQNATPTFKEPAIKSLKEISKLKIPDPWKDGRMHVYLEAIQMASEEFGDEIAIRGCGTGPFSLASHLIGTQEFIMEIAKAEYDLPDGDESAIFHLMEITTKALERFLIAELEAGAHIIQCGDSLASLDVISPETYKKYVYPYEKKLFNNLKEHTKKHNAFSLLHICGDNTKVINLYAETGADCYEVDYKVDLRLCKQNIGGKMCLMGNLNPTKVLLQGTVEEVERAAEECIAAAAENGGFILGSGCEVPMDTPEENMKALVKVARQYQY